MLDTATDLQTATQPEAEACDPASIDALFIVERADNGTIAFFVDPVRPDGQVTYDNQLGQPVRLSFDGSSPYAENPLPLGEGASSPPFLQGAALGTYDFVVEDLEGNTLVAGLQIELDRDGASSSGFLLRNDGTQPIAEVTQTIESGGQPVHVEFETRPSALAVEIQVEGGDPPQLILDSQIHRGCVELTPGATREVHQVTAVELTAQNGGTPQAESIFQNGGTQQAEIIVDP